MKAIFTFILFLLSNKVIYSQADGDAIFNAPQVHEIFITFNQPSYFDSLTSYFANDQYLMGDIEVDGTLLPSVGVKYKGNSSYNNSSRKKSLKIDLNEFVTGQDLDGLKKFNLNNGFKDPSFLREKLTCDFYNEHGLVAPRCTFAKVYINGVYWGLYNFIEETDTKQFLNAHFLYHDGNMFKGDSTGDLRYINNQASTYYPKYELHTNETINDWSDLIELVTKISNSGTAFQDSLETILNTSSFISQWAALNLFVNLDSYLGSGHNYFIYHDTNLDKFEWVGWDVNEAFGSFRMSLSVSALKNLSLFYIPTPGNSRPLINNMVNNPTYRQQLIDKACEWIQYDFSNASMDRKIDSLATIIRPCVYADTNKFYTNQNFEDNINNDVSVQGGAVLFGIKSFILERRTALMNELASQGCLVNSSSNSISENGIQLYPNPAKSSFKLKFNSQSINNSISIYNCLGQTIKKLENVIPDQEIDCSNFISGIYFVILNNSITSRLLIE